MRQSLAPAVLAWIAGRDAEKLYLLVVSEAEVPYGVAIVPAVRRRSALDAAVYRWLDTGFAERILPFDSGAARACADIAAVRRSARRPFPAAECQIAAIARLRGMAVVTRTARDFRDIGTGLTDPWAAV